MARGFTEVERANIRDRLVGECEKSWAVLGYRKTNLDELCDRAGISKGAFYFFYDSKELLFCDVLDIIQERLIKMIEETFSAMPGKDAVCEMLKRLYLEYDKTNILTQRNSSDFVNFLNRAPDEWKAKSRAIGENFLADTIFGPSLKLKMDKKKAGGILNALLAIVTAKDTIGYDHYEVFCTLLDSVIDEIYE